MSRAFVKESDGEDALPDRAHLRHSGLPNYITPAGEAALRQRVAALGEARDEVVSDPERLGAKAELMRLDAERDYLEERLRRAIVVARPPRPWRRVVLGARVGLVAGDGDRQRFTVVGEDEAEPAAGRISWSSPLGRALLGREVGDQITWSRPAGDLELEIESVDFDDPE